MKDRFWLLVPLAFALTGASAAQEIHKCIADGATVIDQNAPCAPAQADAGLLRLPGYADPAERDGASAPAADASVAAPADAPVPAASAPVILDTQAAFPYGTSSRSG